MTTKGTNTYIDMLPDKYNTTNSASNIICNPNMSANAFFLFNMVFCLLLFLLGQTLGFAQGLGDNPLQLTVGTAELIRSPGLYRIHRLSVNAQDKTLGALLSHECSMFNLQCSMIQRTCVHYRLGRIVTAEYHEQVAHHCSLLVVVEVDDVFVRELVECHFYH